MLYLHTASVAKEWNIWDGRMKEWPLGEWVKRQGSGQTERVRWTEGKKERLTDNDRWRPSQFGGNRRSMTYTQPCPTVYHLWLLGTAQGLEEEERWRSLSVPSPCRCLETSHLSVCHWLWGYLASLIEDDSRNIKLVCVCVSQRGV